MEKDISQIEEELQEEEMEDEEEWEEGTEPDPSLYKFVKRVPQRPTAKDNDIFVSRATKFSSLYTRALELLSDPNVNEINIHGLGAATNRAIKLALTVHAKLPKTVISPTTSTEQLIDEYLPLHANLKPITQHRYNSALHINISKK